MTPIELPASPGRREIAWAPVSAVGISRSPFTLVSQVYEWSGQQWQVTVKLPAMALPDGKIWEAFFTRLNGRAGTFNLTDSAFRSRLNAEGLGTPAVAVALTVPSSLVQTSGWTPSMSEIARPGDMIGIGGRVRRVLEMADSDASGNAILRVWPYCANVPAAAPVDWQAPTGVFRLTDTPPMVWGANRTLQPFAFTAEEVLE